MRIINGIECGGGLRLERNNARLLQLEKKKWEDEDFINMTNFQRNNISLELDLVSG